MFTTLKVDIRGCKPNKQQCMGDDVVEWSK